MQLEPTSSTQSTNGFSADPLLRAMMAGFPDAVVLCDRFLAPVLVSDAARWLLADGGEWSQASPVPAQVQAAAAAALDRGAIATLEIAADEKRWEARAAPISHTRAAVCVVLRPASGSYGQRDAVLRAAHDLKAPIHAIEGFAKLLLREAAGPLNADQRRFLEVSASEAARLRAHLDRLLDVVRFAQPREPPAARAQTRLLATDVASLLEDAATRFAGAMGSKKLTLHTEIASPIMAAMPEDELFSIMENLLANAISATPAGGTITVDVIQDVDGMLRCRVTDTGGGIPEAALERVFEPYFRLSETSTEGGTGLGLAICKGLAESRGGRLWAGNAPGGGAVFTLELPPATTPPSALPVLRLAPVTTHAALAAARASLDLYLAGKWQIADWNDGVVTLDVNAPTPEIERAAREIGSATSLACWVGAPA